jgi:nicotinamidase-related amidase
MPVSTLDAKVRLSSLTCRRVSYRLERRMLSATRALAMALRSRALPVVLVNVAGGAPGRKDQGGGGGPQQAPDWMDIVPELDQQPEDHTVTKRTWGAFTNTDLGEFLERSGGTQVVVTGIATSIGVESTTRQAHERGLNVTLATDAMVDGNPDAHTNSVTRIFPRLGETGTTQDILALLETRPA